MEGKPAHGKGSLHPCRWQHVTSSHKVPRVLDCAEPLYQQEALCSHAWGSARSLFGAEDIPLWQLGLPTCRHHRSDLSINLTLSCGAEKGLSSGYLPARAQPHTKPKQGPSLFAPSPAAFPRMLLGADVTGTILKAGMGLTFPLILPHCAIRNLSLCGAAYPCAHISCTFSVWGLSPPRKPGGGIQGNFVTWHSAGWPQLPPFKHRNFAQLPTAPQIS